MNLNVEPNLKVDFRETQTRQSSIGQTVLVMSRYETGEGISIIPKGFELTAHPIFRHYKPKCERNDKLLDISSSSQIPLVFLNGYEDLHVGSSIDNNQNSIVLSDTRDSGSSSQSHVSSQSQLKPNTSPTYGYDDDDARCVICFEDITELTTIVDCTHSFCFECIMAWFEIKTACPICTTISKFIVKRCEVSTRHPHGFKILKIYSNQSDSTSNTFVKDDVKKSKLKIAIAKHNMLRSIIDKKLGKIHDKDKIMKFKRKRDDLVYR